VVRADDTESSLLRKARIAAILGTIQSTFTNFRYVRPLWKKNAEEERILGVSLTGIYDNKLTNGDMGKVKLAEFLEQLKVYVNSVNAELADALGINRSAASTTVKPSGTVSQLTNAASGIHSRHSKFYLRSVRGDNKDPMTDFMKAVGIPNEPCVMKPESTTVFYFPIKAPDGCKTRDDVKALDHLELWMMYNKHWAEHQVSVTINVEENEWVDVGAWVFKNFNDLSGISFLPYDGGTYKQAPYQEIDELTYVKAVEAFPKNIDWSKLSDFEREDTTTGVQNLACVSGVCEIL
jgi:ribonucleoside-diphosphate reductase alpha chain